LKLKCNEIMPWQTMEHKGKHSKFPLFSQGQAERNSKPGALMAICYNHLCFDLSWVVFGCSLSSFLCAHAATDYFTCAWQFITFPVLMSHIYYRFLLILWLSFEVSSHQGGRRLYIISDFIRNLFVLWVCQ
jgi:hypothetical protein